MKKLIAFLMVSFTAYAWSLSYTSVTVDPLGQVCAGRIGQFDEGEYQVISYPLAEGYLYCEKGYSSNFIYNIANLVLVGTDSVLYSTIIDVAMGSTPTHILYDSALVSVGTELMLSDPWTLGGEGYGRTYFALRGVLPITGDSILFAHQNGLSANSFSLMNGRSLSGIPAELATGPVRSLVKDFKNRLWAGTDSGVWVQNAEGDTTWTYHAVGWPVKNIYPMDTNQVVVSSFRIGMDGYDPSTAKKACFESDTLRSNCTTLAIMNLCPRPGECFEVNGMHKGLQYFDHGVSVHSLLMNYIFDLALAPNGKLWAATGYGLYSIDTATFVATREYIGLDTPVVATLPHASQQRLWNVTQQGRNLRVQCSVAGAVDLIDLTGHRVSHVVVNREARMLAVPHAGVWLVRWTSVTGVVDVRRMVVN